MENTENEFITRKEYMESIDLLKMELNRIDDHFERMEQCFNRIDQRFEKMDQRFEKIDQRFDRLEDKFDTLEERMNQRFDYCNARFDYLDKGLSEKVDKKDFRTLITVLRAGNVLNRHEADHFLIPIT